MTASPVSTTRPRGACPRDMLQSRPLQYYTCRCNPALSTDNTTRLCGPDLDIIREGDEVLQQHAPSKEDLRAMENKLIDVAEFDPDCLCVCGLLLS